MMYARPEIFLPFVILAVVLASLARRALRRRRQPLGPEDQPLCGACGYNTRGLTTLTCPECGSDFRITGIGQTATTMSRRIVAFVLCAIGALAMLYFLNRPLVRLVLPTLPATATFDNRVTATSAAYPSRKFKIFSSGRIDALGKQPPVKIEMEIDIAASGVTRGFAMTYFPARNAYTYQHGKIVSGDDFGPEAVLKWMTSADRVTPDSENNVVIVADAETRAEAARVAGLARKVGRGVRVQEPYQSFTRGGLVPGVASRRSTSSGTIFATVVQAYSGAAARPPAGAATIIRGVLLLSALIVIVALFRALIFPRRAPSGTLNAS